MMGLAIVLAAVLIVLSAIHVIWGFGLTWPFETETRLARSVVGVPGITRMPSAAACSSVAVLLLFAAAWAIWLARPHGALIEGGGWAIALVFVARGVAAYMPAFQRLTPEEPFRTNDRLYFGPLCLVLGVSFAILTGAHP